jgi:hypothetical protein
VPGNAEGGPLDLLEDAVHLLRSAPRSSLACYFAGTLPFATALWYFWTDMSRNAFAEERCAALALLLAFLYGWMKLWQAVFAARLRARLENALPRPWGLRASAAIYASQTLLHATSIIILPVAALLTLPMAWTVAFYQNLTALASPDDAAGAKLVRRAGRQALLGPRQNHWMLLIVSLFAVFVGINWLTALAVGPVLCEMFLGVDTHLPKGLRALLSPTVLATALGLTYLTIDPLIKAVYVLRCFRGDGLRSGVDILAELSRLRHPSRSAVVILLAATALGGAGLAAKPAWAQADDAEAGSTASAAEEPGGPDELDRQEASESGEAESSGEGGVLPSPTVAAPQLEDAVQRVLRQSRYAWRLPRKSESSGADRDGPVTRFLISVKKMLYDAAVWVGERLSGFWAWLRDHIFGRSQIPGGSSSANWVQLLIYACIAGAACLLAVLLYRTLRRRRRAAPPTQVQALAPALDVEDEKVLADALSEDGWLGLAKELLASQQFRLALRAFHLAGLSRLAERRLLQIARFKSDHDYERELGRRAHSLPDLVTAFRGNVSVFERVWYGTYAATPELLREFQARLDAFRGGPSA